MKRLFLALPVPESIHEELERLRIGLPGARWMPDLHITIRFLGDISEKDQSLIEELLADLEFPNIHIRLGMPGVFIHPRQIILYLSAVPDDAIIKLKTTVDTLLRPTGLRVERRFHAHCTLARLPDSRSSFLQNYVLQFEHFQTSLFAVDELVLFSSVLQRTGALHYREESYRLS